MDELEKLQRKHERALKEIERLKAKAEAERIAKNEAKWAANKAAYIAVSLFTRDGKAEITNAEGLTPSEAAELWEICKKWAAKTMRRNGAPDYWTYGDHIYESEQEARAEAWRDSDLAEACGNFDMAEAMKDWPKPATQRKLESLCMGFITLRRPNGGSEAEPEEEPETDEEPEPEEEETAKIAAAKSERGETLYTLTERSATKAKAQGLEEPDVLATFKDEYEADKEARRLISEGNGRNSYFLQRREATPDGWAIMHEHTIDGEGPYIDRETGERKPKK